MIIRMRRIFTQWHPDSVKVHKMLGGYVPDSGLDLCCWAMVMLLQLCRRQLCRV